MTLQLGDEAPDFTGETTDGPIQFHHWLGRNWSLFFSHTKDFSSICATELGALAKLKPEFDNHRIQILGLSANDLASHKQWVQEINEEQHCTVNFPIIGDPELKIANVYGMIHPKIFPNLAIRSVFIIDPEKKIRLMMSYPPSVNRDFKEILRAIVVLQKS